MSILLRGVLRQPAGIRVGKAKGLRTAWGRFAIRSMHQVQLISFQRHQQSAQHRRASGVSGEMERMRAPAPKQFKKVLKLRREAGSLRAMEKKFVCCNKIRKMQFCLAEASRHFLRLRLRRSQAIEPCFARVGFRIGSTKPMVLWDDVFLGPSSRCPRAAAFHKVRDCNP